MNVQINRFKQHKQEVKVAGIQNCKLFNELTSLRFMLQQTNFVVHGQVIVPINLYCPCFCFCHTYIVLCCAADAYKPCLRGKGTFDSECPEPYRDHPEPNGFAGGFTTRPKVHLRRKQYCG